MKSWHILHKGIYTCLSVVVVTVLHCANYSIAFSPCSSQISWHWDCQSHFSNTLGHSKKGECISRQYQHADANKEQDVGTTRTCTAWNESLSKPKDQFFWAAQRNEEEIIDYCARKIFPNTHPHMSHARIHVVSTELPLVIIDDFLSNELCEEIVKAAKQDGKMMRSTLGVSQEETETRTSSTTWLREVHCEEPLRLLAGRVSRLSGIPAGHMENLQVVRYEPGQKFDMHTDHLEDFNNLECKGRLATCLLYLNSSWEGKDESEQTGNFFRGGQTYFPEYNVNVLPKRGRAIFWFNTIEKPGQSGYEDEMALTVDLKSRHAGKPVLDGEKWVCNRWVHPISLGNGVRDET
mmetsp:Transcript_7338/g.8446  ORF Transcript_7338/g.8446 Transcript_7338/m.8446 type:complete len:350 (-) Transcript_7338:128-1177(-)